jgi:hypothetical protein
VTWTRAALCWLLAILLGLAVLASGPAEETGSEAVLADRAAAAPDPAAGAAEAAPGYRLDGATLDRVEVRRGDGLVVLERGEAGWKVVAPTDRVIPPGLVQAFLDQLVDSGHGERIAEDAQDAAFGLGDPVLIIDASGGGQRLRLAVGARTPAGTAAYALVEEDGRVVLVGLSLLYYADLLLG